MSRVKVRIKFEKGKILTLTKNGGGGLGVKSENCLSKQAVKLWKVVYNYLANIANNGKNKSSSRKKKKI